MNTNHPSTEPSSTRETPAGATPRRPHSVLDEFQQKQRAQTLLLSALRAVFIVLVVATVALTLASAPESVEYFPLESIAGTLIAALAAAALVVSADIMTPKKDLASVLAIYLGITFGLVASLGFASLINVIAEAWELTDGQTLVYLGLIKGIGGLSLIYLSVSIVLSTKDDFRLVIPYVQFEKRAQGMIPLLVDTSALVDGRLIDLTRTGVIDAPIILPRYVIDELQTLSDSKDRLKRDRGRRGLDLIKELQEAYPDTKLIDSTTSSEDVDRRLLQTAETEGYRIVTTDIGLTKIARIRNLEVMNLNEVARALRGGVVPGSTIEATIVRSGEGAGQGIAYLPDGAMIVVEAASERIGQTLEIEITNSIQRPGGKLVFGRLNGETEDSSPQGMADRATNQPPAPRPEENPQSEGAKLPRNPRRKR
ncbi:MAG: TRAM domain-containing protein [Planctomycetota bacterium]|nr:TRAM domain-containing protein [Planctomycetota bacterium]